MQEGVAATLEKYPFATAAYRAVCDTVNLNCKPNIPPPSITSPHIQKAKEILYSRLSKLATAAAVDRRIIDCLRHIAEIAYARKFVVKGPEHFAFSTFLLRVVNSEILTVCSQLENSSDQRLKFIGLNMKTLSICLQGDFNKMKEDDVKRDAHFGPMLKALLG